MRQAFRKALSTFDSKNALLEGLDGFRYDKLLSGQGAALRELRVLAWHFLSGWSVTVRIMEDPYGRFRDPLGWVLINTQRSST